MRSAIRDQALALGFDAVGFAHPAALADAGARLREFVALGRHGDMGWMATTLERRADINMLWPEARSAVVVALNYGPDGDPLAAMAQKSVGAISVYAGNRDYHDLIKGRLKRLASATAARFAAEVKVFVDTAPVMEKPLAQAAGIGWVGKHTNLVSREFGSWLFLGVMLTTLELELDPPEHDHCGTCRRCLAVCPTNAFPAPYQLDARRCIAYLTNEHSGHIAAELRPLIGNRIYGCDDCLAVCPWNRFARVATEAALRPRASLRDPALAELAALDDAGFRKLFAANPVKRIGRARFLRNVLIAIGNSGDKALVPAVRRLIEDPSPLVRAMAAWALKRLLGADDFAALAEPRRRAESDPEVRAEWR